VQRSQKASRRPPILRIKKKNQVHISLSSPSFVLLSLATIIACWHLHLFLLTIRYHTVKNGKCVTSITHYFMMEGTNGAIFSGTRMFDTSRRGIFFVAPSADQTFHPFLTDPFCFRIFCHCFACLCRSFPRCLLIFLVCFVAGGRRSVRLLLRVSTSLPLIAIGDKV